MPSGCCRWAFCTLLGLRHTRNQGYALCICCAEQVPVLHLLMLPHAAGPGLLLPPYPPPPDGPPAVGGLGIGTRP